MKSSLSLLSFIIIYYSPQLIASQPAISMNAWSECRDIKNAKERLKCYDTLSTPRQGSVEKTQTKEIQTKTATPSSQEDKPKTGIEFGFEQKAAEQTPDKIVSHIPGQFSGWNGKTTFRLANGQVWKQTSSDRVRYITENPTVTIKKGLFGTFFLYVDGINSRVRVKRIK